MTCTTKARRARCTPSLVGPRDHYKQVIEMFRGGQPYIHDPFEERDVKVVFGSLAYDGTSEEFTFELYEDKD